MLQYLETHLNIGATAPFTFIHASDTHLTRADERDDQRKLDLAKSRTLTFPEAEEGFAALSAMPRDTLITHTGDLLDFVSAANIDAAREFTSTHDCFFAAGNHEFSLYVGEAWEDAAYRRQSFKKVQAAFKNPIRYAMRRVNGVRFVAIDNSYYLIDPWQLDALEWEVEYNEPIILFMHTPLYAPDLAENEMLVKKNPCAYLMGAPEELLETYEPYRRRQQTPDKTTLDAIRFITTEPMIKAVFTGHLHTNFTSQVTDRLTQYVTGLDTIRTVTVE